MTRRNKILRAEAGDEGDGGGNDDKKPAEKWSDNLPESIRGWEEVTNSDSSEKFFEQMANMRGRMGRSIVVPGEDAGEDAVTEFYGKLKDKVPGLMATPDFSDEEATKAFFQGVRPETAEVYKTPEGISIPEERMAAIKQHAWEQGLHTSQFDGFLATVLKEDNEAVDAGAKVLLDSRNELKKEWGEAHDQRESAIGNFLKKTDAPPELLFAHENKQLGGETLKWLYNNMSAYTQKGEEFYGQGSGAVGMTPAEAQEKIQEIYGNPKHAFFDSMHAGHQAAMDKVVLLMKTANPKSSTDENDLRAPRTIPMG